MTESTNPVVDRLYELRDSRASWKEVARLLGISPSYLSDIINGRREISDKLARKLGCRRKVEYVEEANR